MNGSGAVETTKAFHRVYEAYVSQGATNVANISVYDNSQSNELLRIDVEESDAQSAIYTVPVGYDFHLIQWHGSETSNQATKFAIWKRTEGDIWRIVWPSRVINTPFHFPSQLPLVFGEKCDIALRAKADSSSHVTGGFEGYIEKRA